MRKLLNQQSARSKLALLFCLYFSQGLPFGFFSQALPPLLREQGVDLKSIGFISMLGVPWVLKFLWAPYVDQYGSARFGHHKSWIVPLQGLSMGVLLLVSLLKPDTLAGDGLYWLLFLLFLSHLFAATQDIATDALAVQTLSSSERGMGNGVQVAAYRVGMVFGGGLILVLIDRLGWSSTFVVMALCLGLVTLPIFFYQENTHSPVKGKAGPANVGQIFVRFLRQKNMIYWVAVVLVYKSADSFGSAMSKPLLVDIGLSLEQIGWLAGTLGMVAAIVGALFGGYCVPKLGRVRALFYFGLLQALSFSGYWWIALGHESLNWVMVVTLFEHFTGGMATAALFTLMMDACRPQVAGTDYTVQASIQVAVGGLLHLVSGLYAEWFGYAAHFATALVLGLALLAIVVVWSRHIPEQQRLAWKN